MTSNIITPVASEDRPIVTLPTTKPAWGFVVSTPNIQNLTTMPNISTDSKAICPTCGTKSMWSNQNYDHQICLPSIGPAKPKVNNDDSYMQMYFDTDNMTAAERVATGCNISRCQTITTDNCALCFHPCQEQSGSMWNQFTGWKFVHMHCWQDLCLRYHEDYLEPNNLVNTLGNWLKFLED